MNNRVHYAVVMSHQVMIIMVMQFRCIC